MFVLSGGVDHARGKRGHHPPEVTISRATDTASTTAGEFSFFVSSLPTAHLKFIQNRDDNYSCCINTFKVTLAFYNINK